MAKTLPIAKVETHLRETLNVLSDPDLMGNLVTRTNSEMGLCHQNSRPDV